MRKIYEAAENNGARVISDWEYYKTHEAKIDQKLHMLQAAEVDPKTRKAVLPQDLLAGPGVYGQKWIYKLKIKGDVALRPMVCLGPRDHDAEWTVLFRAVEKGNKLVPDDAADRAEQRRQEIAVVRRARFLLLDVIK